MKAIQELEDWGDEQSISFKDDQAFSPFLAQGDCCLKKCCKKFKKKGKKMCKSCPKR